MTHSVPTAFVNAVGTEWVTPGFTEEEKVKHEKIPVYKFNLNEN